MREKARLDSFRRPLKSWLTHTGTLSGKQCLSVAVSEQIPRANLNTSSQIMRPALQTEFSVLKHSQTFWIWDWALHDIFPKSRLVMVAESSGRRSMRNSAPLSQPFRLCDRMKWMRGNISAQLIYYFMTKDWSESCGHWRCSETESLIKRCADLRTEITVFFCTLCLIFSYNSPRCICYKLKLFKNLQFIHKQWKV